MIDTMRRNEPFEAYFSRTAKRGPDDCWLWLGSRDAKGYGIVSLNGKNKKAAHLALALHGYPRPNGALALHSCDNPPCVNPSHLRWGSDQDNTSDKMQRGRLTLKFGSANPMFKMTDDVISAVLASEEASGKIAARLGVSTWMVQKIRKDNGVARKPGAPTVFADIVYEALRAAANDSMLVHKPQTAVSAELGSISPHVNRAIKLLIKHGRLKPVLRHSNGTWTYEVVPSP